MLLDTFKILMGYGFELAKYREGRAHDRFDGLVRPMYESILSIHADYVRMFNKALAALHEDTPLEDVVVALHLDRTTSNVMRHEFFRVASSLNEAKGLPKEILHFVDEICQYIDALTMYNAGTPSSVVRNYLHILQLRGNGEQHAVKVIESRQNARHFLTMAISRLDIHAKSISSSYSTLLNSRYA